jgi:hypothetical protein
MLYEPTSNIIKRKRQQRTRINKIKLWNVGFFSEISLTFKIFMQYQEDSLNIPTVAEEQKRKIPGVQKHKLWVIRSKL